MFDLLKIISLIVLLLITVPLLGKFLSQLVQGKYTILHPFLGWLERLSYRIAGINPDEEMEWRRYAKVLFWFNLAGGVALFFILILQKSLPYNPHNFSGVPWLVAFNTAASFTTNTNWQAYAGETTMSYASQMWGLTVQNFLSAATGCAVLMAIMRGIIRKSVNGIGNYWVDMVRSVIYLLLPLSIILSLVLITQGTVQTLSPYAEIETLEGGSQIIPLGPVASQVAIRQLGTNGGGFFNANGAHPFENPTPLTNFLETFALILIPGAWVYAYGLLVGSRKHAWLLLIVMFLIWCMGIALSAYSENLKNPVLDAFPMMEGKETRFGITNSLLWSTLTTATSNGAVNNMHSSLSPLAGGIALFNMMLEELVFGGVGVGLASMFMFIFLTVFLCALMVGRTPEYMGKKIEKKDIQWVILAVLAPNMLILIGASIACLVPDALNSLSTRGPHGLTELLYAFTSASANNGSAFAGINANTAFYNISLGIIMILARLSILVPSLAIAGNLAAKKITPQSLGTLSTNTSLFGVLLFSVILILCGLTFIPVLSLGPIVEHLLMLQGQAFPFSTQ